jgi:hypothetical protein
VPASFSQRRAACMDGLGRLLAREGVGGRLFPIDGIGSGAVVVGIPVLSQSL